MTDYTLYQSDYIANNQDLIFEDINRAHNLFRELFPNQDSTWTYDKYNVFALTSPSTAFYKIYTELRNLVRGHLGDDRPLWFQAWLNYHQQPELLNWHEHAFEYHGYIAIDPKNTKTVFKDYEILNRAGQIYFGPGYRQHMVEAITPFQGVRTTIGFDIITLPTNDIISRPYGNMGLMPLL
jgi:hypothetical protein